MSFQVTTAFVQQYKSGIEMLLQQRGSRLRSTVMEESVDGKTAFFDQIGSVSAQKVTNRHGDSPLNQTPHARRRVALFDYETGDLIDRLDKVRTLNDPTNAYVQTHAWAMGRGIDDEIITAADGTAYSGEDGSTAVPFNTDYSIAHGSTGLTINKLREAKYLLDAAENDPSERRYCVVSAKQIQNLLATTEVTNSDYAVVKALAQGVVDSFLGFTFVPTERLGLASNIRTCFAYVESAIKLGIGMNPIARVTERADKRFSWYAYFCMSIGAVRMQEEKIVRIYCDETA